MAARGRSRPGEAIGLARAHRGEQAGGRAGERARSREPGVRKQPRRARQGRSGARGARGVGTGARACVADLDAAGTLLRRVRSTRAIQQLASRATVAGSDWERWRLRLRRLERGGGGGGGGSPATPAETRVETQRLLRLPVNALRSARRQAATSRCVSARWPPRPGGVPVPCTQGHAGPSVGTREGMRGRPGPPHLALQSQVLQRCTWALPLVVCLLSGPCRTSSGPGAALGGALAPAPGLPPGPLFQQRSLEALPWGTLAVASRLWELKVPSPVRSSHQEPGLPPPAPPARFQLVISRAPPPPPH